MKRLRPLLLSAAICGLLVPALAGNNDPDSTTGYQTAWTIPVGVVLAGAGDNVCDWRYTIGPRVIDDRKHDPPTATGFGCFIDGYAHCIADGMQVFAYSWAYDDCVGAHGSAAISAASVGTVSVFAATVPEGCTAVIQGDWKPRVRVRAHQFDPPGECIAGTVMAGEIRALDINVCLAQELKATSDKTVTNLGVRGSFTAVGGVGLSVPLTIHEAATPIERTLTMYVVNRQPISSAFATYSGEVWAASFADAGMSNWTGESESYVWDSVPGLDLHGECEAPCTGGAYVVYGWY